jgi:hypothetical protein
MEKRLSESEQEWTGSTDNGEERQSDQLAERWPSADAAASFQVTDEVVFQSMTPVPEAEALPGSPAVSQFISQTNSDTAPSLNEDSSLVQTEHDALSAPTVQGAGEPGVELRRNRSLFAILRAAWVKFWQILIGPHRGLGGIGDGESAGYEGSGGG